MKKIAYLFVVLLLTGCAKLAHINELLTLKAMSDEQGRNDKIVQAYDDKFAALIEAQINNQLLLETKKSILKKFTKPIYTETLTLNGQPVDRWIYRSYVQYFDTDQMHLYFDSNDKLIISEYIPAPKKESTVIHGSKAKEISNDD